MKIKSLVVKNVDEFIVGLKQTIDGAFSPNMAIVFSDPSKSNVKIANILEVQNIAYIFASSSGEIVDGKILANTISISLYEINPNYFKIVKQEIVENNSYQVGVELATIGNQNFQNPAYITLFTMELNGEKFLSGMEDVSSENLTIYGGMAADEVNINPFLYTGSSKLSNSVHTIVLDSDKIEVDGIAIDGWKEIGSEHEITNCENNILREINNEPALDFFHKFFGFHEDQDLNVGKIVNSQYPLQIKRKGDSILRAPLGADDDNKTLILAGPVNIGEKFKFSIAPGFQVINNTVEKFKKFVIDKPNPDAIILFSCKARHWAFGPMLEDEVEEIDKLWDVPFHGFFTFGEIGKNENGNTHFFNETCSLVTLREK